MHCSMAATIKNLTKMDILEVILWMLTCVCTSLQNTINLAKFHQSVRFMLPGGRIAEKPEPQSVCVVKSTFPSPKASVPHVQHMQEKTSLPFPVMPLVTSPPTLKRCTLVHFYPSKLKCEPTDRENSCGETCAGLTPVIASRC